MAVIIDATVGGESANSYVTFEFAESILDAELDASAWTGAASDDIRKQSLIDITRYIETFNLIGSKYIYTQALHFPAKHNYLGIIDTDSDGNNIIPTKVKLATCLGALWRLRHVDIKGINEEIMMGINQSTVGGFSRSGGSKAAALIGPMALSYLRKYIKFTGKII